MSVSLSMSKAHNAVHFLKVVHRTKHGKITYEHDMNTGTDMETDIEIDIDM
jgi:hypothetical protein